MSERGKEVAIRPGFSAGNRIVLTLILLAGLSMAAAQNAAARDGWHRLEPRAGERADSTIVGYGVEAEGDSLTASLLVCRCRGGVLELFVIPDTLEPVPFDVVHEREVTIGIDSSPTFRQTWTLSNVGVALFAPDPYAFTTRLLHAGRLFLRLDGSQLFEFAVRGFDEPLRTLLATCPDRSQSPTSAHRQASATEDYVAVDDLPEAISKVAPIYPEEAREHRVQGTVVVQVYLDEDGRVIDTKVVRSITGLDAAAVASVRQWRFKPAMTAGKPVKVWMAIPIKFTLQ